MYSSSHSKESFQEAFARKRQAVNLLEKQVHALLRKDKIKSYTANATLKSRNEINLQDGERIFAEKILIATGSTPIIPSKLKALGPKLVTSDEIIELDKIPKSVLIIGGGYVGCEFAAIFANYGVKVYLIELLPKILNSEDDDIVREVYKAFEKRNVEVYVSAQFERDSEDDCILLNSKKLDAELVLIAIGRHPNSNGLGLESLGVKLNSKGAVMVNERMETNIPGLYAIGDVIDKDFRLAHVAEAEAFIAVKNSLGIESKMNYNLIPTAIFTEPEIASVGLREYQLKNQRKDYVVGKSWFRNNPMSYCSNSIEGFTKIIVDRNSHKILGASIAGANASDLIHELVIAVSSDAAIETVAESIHFHPSRSECIKRAAEDALRKLMS